VLALAAIGHAARLGHPDAQGFFPHPMMASLLDPVGPVADRPITEDTPLADLPTEWFQATRQVVDHHRACWPEP
jgi:hypothetical protein